MQRWLCTCCFLALFCHIIPSNSFNFQVVQDLTYLNSTGGISTSATYALPELAIFTNSSGEIFVLGGLSSLTPFQVFSRTLNEYVYYSLVALGSVFLGTNESHLIHVELRNANITELDVSNIIPAGGFGGGCIPAEGKFAQMAFLTGLQNAVAIDLTSFTIAASATIDTSLTSLLDVACTSDMLYFSGTTATDGYVYKVSPIDLSVIAKVELTGQYWPFGINAVPQQNIVDVFASHYITQLDSDTLQVTATQQIPDVLLSEMMCFSVSRKMAFLIASSSESTELRAYDIVTGVQVGTVSLNATATEAHSCAVDENSDMIFVGHANLNNDATISVVSIN